MNDRAELLDALLDGAPVADSEMRELVQLAATVAEAVRSVALSSARRERIRSRAFSRSRRRLRLAARTRPALLGGAAVTVVAAAVGLAVLRGRRHAPAAA
jgi:hypothetical protein